MVGWGGVHAMEASSGVVVSVPLFFCMGSECQPGVEACQQVFMHLSLRLPFVLLFVIMEHLPKSILHRG